MKKLILSFFLILFCFSLTACSMRETADKLDPNKNGVSSMLESDTVGATSNDIGRDKAKETALKHAGLEEKKVYDLEVDLDTENGKKVYEVSFDADGFDYDYDIDAKSGEIIFSQRDPE